MRDGTCSIIFRTQPLAGTIAWRPGSGAPGSLGQDVEQLLVVDYSQAEQIVLWADGLTTYSIGSLHQTFEPARARAPRSGW